MKIRPVMCVLWMCLASALAAQALVERSILVTVLDKDGAPLRDLSAGDFIVREDGQPREVTTAVPAPDPLAVALLIDTSKPTIGTDLPLRDIRAALKAFVNTIYAANPESKISLMEYSGAAVKTVNFTSNGDQMLKATGRIVTSQRSSGVLIEGLVDTGKDLSKATTPRRAIVVLSFDAPEASTTQPRDAAVAVQKSGAAFWAVTVGSGSSPAREVIFESLPEVTGGRRITMLSASALEQAMTNVAGALTSQYLVTYKRPDGPAASTIQAGATKGATVLRASWMK